MRGSIVRGSIVRGSIVAVVLLLALAGCTGGDDSDGAGQGGPAKAPASGLTQATDCGSGMTCAFVTVPLDHHHPAAGTLKLRVAVETDADAPRGVLVSLAGGPGQAGVPLAQTLTERFGDKILGAYRLVVLDQRGTGNTALRCPAMQAAMGFSDLTPPSASAVTACARELGPDRQFYSTEDVVADLDQLREVLGADRITLMGTSYGTFVAEHYAIAHPDRLRSLVLDSVVPHSGVDPLGVDVMRASRRVLRAACEAEHCNSDPVADLAAVVARYHDGVTLLDVLTGMSIIQPTFAPMISALAQARDGNTAALDGLVAGYANGFQGPAGELSQGLHASALCSDIRFPWGTSTAPLAGREAAVQRLADTHNVSDFAPFDRATAVGNGVIRQCLPWPPVPSAGLPVGGDLPAVPTLLVAGGRDLSTPLEWALREAAHAPEGQIAIDPTSGHSVYGRGGIGKEAVDEFLL